TSVHQHREPEDAYEPSPRSLSNKLAHPELPPHPRKVIAARSSCLIDQHYFGTLNRSGRILEIRAITHRPVRSHRSLQNINVVVGSLAAAVKAFVYDDRLFVSLGEEITFEVGVTQGRGIGNVYVRHTPAGRFIYFLQITFDPVAIPECCLIGNGHDLNRSRSRSVRVRTYGDLNDLA